jgi:hypothetical protein
VVSLRRTPATPQIRVAATFNGFQKKGAKSRFEILPAINASFDFLKLFNSVRKQQI